ncbi:hypothetical protein BN14_11590 [Rhizoctonia solani AG-1 IB]|uniref:Fungal zn(2)-Cys(6) binuclear cluster domain-containing protein n=1 Tax=Thanatephorus cucumeris (strain AG1-IB / isolate 7/3/14) TaxID=1108050 RepID=M5CDU5_THACB|nr:hypothetical protein BN14_11590 [Rhizoctonia solani AG-1 IB]
MDVFSTLPPLASMALEEITPLDMETSVDILPSGLPDLSGYSFSTTSHPNYLAPLGSEGQTSSLHSSSRSMKSPNEIEIIDLTTSQPDIPDVSWTQLTTTMVSPNNQLIGQYSAPSAHGSKSLAVARAPTGLTSGQASLFEALFSLAQPDSALLPPSDSQPFPTPHLSSSSSSSSQSPWASPEVEDDTSDTSEDDDRDNARQLWCLSPSMDSSIPTNSLPYVLQSYANWLNYTTFEPLKLVHPTKECVIAKFSSSQEQRTKIILIANAMSMLRRTRNPRGVSLVAMLASQVHETISIFKSKTEVIPGSEQQNAQAALDHIVEILGVQLYSSPLASVIQLLEDTAPVFRSACPDPPTQLISLPDLLLGPWVHLRYFAVTDVTLSITTGRPMFFRYNVEFSLDLCERMAQRKINFGLTWMHGMPDELVLLFAWMNNLREEVQLGTPIREETVSRIEQDIKELRITPSKAADPMLKVSRLVVQECWRQVAYIYLYMALCGAHAQDTRVEKQTKAFMRLVNGTAPGRNPDAFLVIPAVISADIRGYLDENDKRG